MKLSNVLRSTFGFVFAVVLLAAGPLAIAQDAEEYGEGVPFSPTAALGSPATSVQQVSIPQASTTSTIADPTKGIAGSKAGSLNLANGPSTSGFTVFVSFDTALAQNPGSPLESVFMIGDGQNNDTDIAFALLRDHNGYWYIAKRVDGPLSQPLVMYANRLWDPLQSPCVIAYKCSFDTVYVTFATNGSIYLDEYATLSNPAPGTSKYSWYEGVAGSGYPALSYPAGTISTPPTGAINFAPATSLYTGGISANWFNAVGNPPTSSGGSNVGGPVTNPVAFNDNALNSVNALGSYYSRIDFANGILGTDGSLAGLRNYIVQDQQKYQSTSDPVIVNGTYPCNSGQFENSTPGSTQLSYSPIFLATPCQWPGSAPLGQLSPSHADFYSSTQLWVFTVTNVGQPNSQLDISLIQVEPIDSTAGTTYLDNFRVTGGTCLVNSVLSFQQSCTVQVQFYPGTDSLINNNVRLRIYTNADLIAVPMAAPLFGYSDLAVPDNCSALGYPGCDQNNQTTYTMCASEGGSCTFSGDRNVVYGANGVFTNPVTLTNRAQCNDAFFKVQPNGFVNACYMSPPIGYIGASGYQVGSVYCADQGGTCSYEGSANQVMAGGGGYHSLSATWNNFVCDPAKFGFKDFINRACFYQGIQGYVSPHTGPDGYQFCAGEGTGNGVCQFKGLGRIAWGALDNNKDPHFNYGVFNGGVACNNNVFPPDPLPGTTKDCYYQVITAATSVTSTGAGSGTSTCDIYASGGTPCVAAHSTVRALFGGYSGRLYQVTRSSDNTTMDIGTLVTGGYANAAAQDSFCPTGTTCNITIIYDQTSNHNDLKVPGGDSAAIANALPITVNGNNEAYGVQVTSGVGYRNNATTSVATGSSPEGMYMVTSGTYVNGGCCFDYGNAETDSQDDGAGRMDALNFGTYCEFAPCSGSGPWVEADLENGQYMGDGNNPGDVSMGYDFVTAMLKNDGTSTFALKGGNAQSGGLTTDYSGTLPTVNPGYIPMNKKGAIILGTGGDNSDTDIGAFFEGAMTSGYPTDATESAVQANIVAASYFGNSGGSSGTGSGISVPPGPYTGPSDPGGPGPQDGFISPATEQPNDIMATKPALASFNGSLYVAFEGVNAGNDLYVTSSSTGYNFPAATRYTNLVSSSAPALAAFNNQLFMAFRGLNVNNDFYVTSSSTGSTFPTATQYTNIQMGGAPALAEFNGQLCAAFQANDPGHTLHVTCSPDGATWPTAWQVPNVRIGSDPAMAVFRGILYVAFRADDPSNDVWIASSSDGVNFSSQVLPGQTMAGTSAPALMVSNGVLYYIYGANDTYNEMLVTASTDGNAWQGPAAYLGVQMGATGPGAAAFGDGITVGFQSNDSRNVLFVTHKATEADVYTGPSDPGGSGPQDGFVSPAIEQPNDVMATKPALASFNGSLYVAFEGVGVDNDLFVASSSTGYNFPAATRYTNLQASSAPAMAVFNNQLYMAFRGLNVNNDFYVTSSSSGSGFPTATQYTNIQMGGAPALAVFNNQLCAAFQADDPSHNLFVTCSSDGVTWPAAWQVPNVRIGSDPAMAVFNSKLYIAFRADDPGNEVWVASSPDGHSFSSQELAGQTMGWSSSPALVVSHSVIYYIYGANDADNEMLVTASTDGSTWQGPKAYLDVQMGAAGPGAAAFGSGVYVGFQSNDSRNVLFVTNNVTGGPVPPEQPQPPTTTNPVPGAFTNHSVLLSNLTGDDPNWYLQNIPFLEVPDTQIQQAYYYRWQTYKEHLVYTSPFYGWLSTEFLEPASYGAPYGGIDAAAGHQTIEGRWLWTEQYVKDNMNYWLKGPGQFAKPQTYAVNPDTADWAHEYSYWAASSVWQWYLATGDSAFVTALLPQLQTQYHGWDNHFNSQLGLYWQYPVWDATEYSPASYESSDPYHGGAGYRPTINSFQFGDANAIAQIANLAGNSALASQYSGLANALQAATQQYLWDPTRNFFYHMNRDNNPSNALLDTREEEGFVPWMFELPSPSDSSAMAELLDPAGFQTAYGPPTAEKRSGWYMYQASSGCCHWDGPSWPYETSQTLTGFANLLIDYPQQQYVDANDYVNLLHTYAATQYKNGAPYVAEAHDPDNNNWIYDTPDHSEDYNHSTYIDNVISGLIGLRGQPNSTLLISPLVPPSWDYFALENTPYHGHSVTVLWDRLGTRYKQGTGLSVFVDNSSVVHQSTLSPVTVNVGSTITQTGDGLFDVAVNTQQTAYGPQPIASYVFSPEDNIWNGIDGMVFRVGIPENTRWTTYLSPNSSDYYGVNFKENQTIQQLRLTFYDDGGGVRVPAGYIVQYWDGINWNTFLTEGIPAPNAMTILNFAPITTSQIRVSAANSSRTQGWGLSELQAMSTSPGVQTVSAGVYQITNVNSNKMMGVHNEYPFDSAQIQQYDNDGTPDHFWVVEDAGGGYFKLLNIGTNLVLGVSGESTANSAPVVQFEDNGTPDHLWKFIPQQGVFKIQNQNSGLLLGVSGESTANSANIVQFQDNGTPDHLWVMTPVADPRGIPVYKYMNYNSGDVLAVEDESQADGAQIQQYADNQAVVNYFLTPDHLWEKDNLGAGFYMLRNVLSNLVLGVDQESTANSALIKQAQNNGTPDHIWAFAPQFLTVPNAQGDQFQCSLIGNYNSGLVLGVDGESTANGANVVQFQNNGTPDHDWCEYPVFPDPRTRPVYKIANVNSGLILAVQDESTAPSAQIQQYSDTGTNDHIWQLEDAGGGYFKILNLRSNMVLGVSGESTADSASVVQFEDNGTPDHLWQFIPAGNDQFKIQNLNSGLLLGVSGESTADSANVVQFHDNGTPDHLWLLEATGWPTLFP